MNAVSVKSIAGHLDRLRRWIKIWLLSHTTVSHTQSLVSVGEIRRGGMVRLALVRL